MDDQFNELICPICHFGFNEEENLALMLPTCGHSICKACLGKMLKLKEVICPED